MREKPVVVSQTASVYAITGELKLATTRKVLHNGFDVQVLVYESNQSQRLMGDGRGFGEYRRYY